MTPITHGPEEEIVDLTLIGSLGQELVLSGAYTFDYNDR